MPPSLLDILDFQTHFVFCLMPVDCSNVPHRCTSSLFQEHLTVHQSAPPSVLSHSCFDCVHTHFHPHPYLAAKCSQLQRLSCKKSSQHWLLAHLPAPCSPAPLSSLHLALKCTGEGEGGDAGEAQLIVRGIAVPSWIRSPD